MDPILIGTVVSEHMIREMSKPAEPLVKELWQKIIFINIHGYMIHKIKTRAKTRFLPASSLTYRNIPQNS